MRGEAVLLISVVSLALGAQIELNENGCPLDYTYEQLYPHENCNRFYQCFHGDLVEHRCASDLLFDVTKQECDWPQKVECGERVIPDVEPEDNDAGDNDSENNGGSNCDPSEAPALCAAEGSDGVLVAHENCNQFYKCSEGLPVTLTCPSGLLYNSIKEQCDWPENVVCGDRDVLEVDTDENGEEDEDNGSGNTTCNCNPGEAPTICAAEGSDGVLIAHQNCNQFYKCFNGIPVSLYCPDNLLYDPAKELCDWPENVDCGERVCPDSENGTEGGAENDTEEEESDNGESGSGDNNSVCNCSPGEAPTICAGQGSDGTLVAHENCNQFYKCAHGLPVAVSCPGTLLYNPVTQWCDWPENVDCGDRPILECDNETDNGNDNGNGDSGTGEGDGGDSGNGEGGNGDNGGSCNCNPGEAPTICAGEGSDGTLVAHETCNQFYKCAHGLPVAVSCPGTLLYNPLTERCDWPENVDCGDRPIPDCDNETDNGNDNGNGDSGTGESDGGDSGNGEGGNGDNNGSCNCNPGEAPTICAGEGSDGTLVAHENCNQFYKCAHGLPVAVSCPGSLLYNPLTQRCDWPENVDCGDRPIPDCDNETDSGNDNGNGDSGAGEGDGGDSGNGEGGNGDNDGSCNCNPGEAPTICAGAGSDGTLVAHENCNQFYKCAYGLPVAMSCPGTLLYNPLTQQCDWPENVDCGDRPIPECDNETDSGNDNGNGDSGTGEGDGGDSGNGEGGNGEGGNGDNDGSCNCNPGEAPTICAGEGSDGTLVAHENCNQFYKCAHGLPVAMSCPGTLLYNPLTQQCDWPENVDCGDRPIPECDNETDSGNDNGNGDSGTGEGDGSDSGNGEGGNGDNDGSCNCNPGEAPTICAGEGSDGTLVAHENCNQFYKCAHGLPVAVSCPGSLLYNPFTQRCDWPENVECGDRIIPDCDNETDNGNDNGNGDSGTGEGDGGDSGNGEGGNGDNGGSCNCNPGEAPTICAGEGSDGTLVAHENCNQFYKCAHGLPVAVSCPGSLLYNPITQRCDWPENVDCGDRIIPDSDNETDGGNDNGNGDNGTGEGDGGDSGNGEGGNGDNDGSCNCNPGEAPTICAGEGSDGTLVAHENCNQFYKCAHGLPVAVSCPGSLLYNPLTQRCDWPENVDCGDRIIPDSDNETDGGNDNGNGDSGTGEGDGGDSGNGEGGNGDNGGSCNCNPGEAPTICAGEGSDGTLVAHENCNQFYKCAHGLPVAVSCPGSLLYNPLTQRCDWPENVDCGDRIIPDCDNETDNGNDNGNGDSGTGEGDGGDSGNGEGGNGDNGGSCNCNPGEAPTICAGEGSDGTLVAHENCNQFYKCAHGLPVAVSCPGSLLYNPFTQRCDWPENVECGDRIIPDSDNETDGGNDNGNGDSGTGEGDGGDSGNGEGGNGDNDGSCNCNPGEAPTICAGEGSDGTLVAHENCNQFYKCAYGLPVAMSCPGTLLYNPLTQRCDWPENVECGDRIIPESDNETDGGNDNGNGDSGTGEGDGGDSGNGEGGNGDNDGSCNCNPGEAPTICAGEGSDGSLVAHENCNQFYKCAYGLPVAMSCPGTLLYNPLTQRCDWPENVECGDRIIPESDNETDGGNDNDNGDSGTGESDGGDSGNGEGGNGDNDGSCNCNPGEAPTICAGAGSDGTLVAHENCNQFYKCAYGLPVAMSCPGTLLYNPLTEQCDWPENVDCGDRQIPECDNETDSGNDNGNGDSGTGEGDGGDSGNGEGGNGDNDGSCNCNPGEAPSICSSSGSNDILIAHENCNQFYQCADGLPVVLTCPETLLYNPYTSQCDWPQNVNCTDRIIPDCDNESNGNGDEGTGGDDSNNGDGGSGDNSGSCNCDPSEAPSICARADSNNILIAHENCNQFYICSSEVPISMTCWGNLLYNPYKEVCDWPENVDCGERAVVEIEIEDGNNESDHNDDNSSGGNTDPSEAPIICAGDGSDGVLVAHENCNQFYICSNKNTVVLNCSDNLLYDALTGRCQWPALVDCGNRVIPETEVKDEGSCSCNSRLAPAMCVEKSFDGALIAHEYCDQFYKCANGVPVSYSCPHTLLYNPYKEICDWPQNVMCEGRTISYYLSMNKHLSGRKLTYSNL